MQTGKAAGFRQSIPHHTMAVISVLLIDDNVTLLRHLTRFLEREDDLRVIGTAQRGEEGLQEAMDLHPDVVILDLSLPDLSGLDLLPQLKEAAPEARIVILTSLDETVYQQEAFDRGADAFVAKGELTEMLVSAILRVAGGEAAA